MGHWPDPEPEGGACPRAERSGGGASPEAAPRTPGTTAQRQGGWREVKGALRLGLAGRDPASPTLPDR